MEENTIQGDSFPQSSSWPVALVVSLLVVGGVTLAGEKGFLPEALSPYSHPTNAIGHFVLLFFGWLIAADLIRFSRFSRMYAVDDVETARNAEYMKRSLQFCFGALDPGTVHKRADLLKCLDDGQAAFRQRWQWRLGAYYLVPLGAIVFVFVGVLVNFRPVHDLSNVARDLLPLAIASCEVLVVLVIAFAVNRMSEDLLSKWRVLANHCVNVDPRARGELEDEIAPEEPPQPLKPVVQDDDDDWSKGGGYRPAEPRSSGPARKARSEELSEEPKNEDDEDFEEDRPRKRPDGRKQGSSRKRQDDDDDNEFVGL